VADRLVRLVMIISAAIASVVIVGIATGAAALNSPAGVAARFSSRLSHERHELRWSAGGVTRLGPLT